MTSGSSAMNFGASRITFFRQAAVKGDQPGGRVVAVFGLADEIPGDDFRVRGLVGDDHDLGRAGEHVDADPAIEDALGLGHELVARADQDVGRAAAEEPEGHGGDPLHAAERQDHVGAAEIEGIENRRVHALAGLRAASRRSPDRPRRPWPW